MKLGLCHLRCPKMKVFILDYLSKTDATPLQRAYTDQRERERQSSKRNKRNSPTISPYRVSPNTNSQKCYTESGRKT
jgi:hypothetical protein